MRNTLPDRVRIGVFEVDLRAGELRDGERVVCLREQSLFVLRILVERTGAIVTREELKRRLWPNDTVVDFDHGINAAIRRLRQALGDYADEPKYIATIARRGYRLMVPVVPALAPADESSADYSTVTPISPGGQGNAAIGAETTCLIGKRVSHYRVLSVIGGGGMGLVYEAEDLKLGRRVALKFLPEELASHPIALQRFEREARTASSLNHPNICTIYEIEEHEQQPFIVMELLEGETLRDRLANLSSDQKKLPLDELLETAIEICSGLQAAHDKGIVHRDIKPANIFLTTSGQAKILDFGVAKLIEQAETASERLSAIATAEGTADAVTGHLTGTGLAIGTAGYMSPEQVRGEKLDARTDIFSFGLVLYEMAAGQRAFVGDTALDVQGAILNQTPIPLRERNPSVPRKLEEIINRAIEKDRERRYGSATEVGWALEDLRDEAAGRGTVAVQKRGVSWPSWLAGAAVLCVALIAGGLYWRSRTPPKLTRQDTIVIADFDNKTEDAVFDVTLKTALHVSLRQSPFLNILSDGEVEQTLQQMTRPANSKLTPDLSRDLCLRSGSKAYIAGTIATLGSEYVVGLKAVNCQTGDALAEEQVTAHSKEEVLDALGRAGSKLRSQLGESLATVQQFDVPLYQATTPSLEALKEYSLGREADKEKGGAASLPYHLRAIELDPNFASSYFEIAWIYETLLQPARASEYFTKAFALREHSSERERLGIASSYYSNVTGELDKASDVIREAIDSYPRDSDAYDGGVVFAQQGQYEKALESIRKALTLAPDRAYIYGDLALCSLALQRFDEAARIIHDAQQRNLGENIFHNYLYAIAFHAGDSAAMAEQRAWFAGQPEYASEGFALASDTEAYIGKVTRARELTTQAVDSALGANSTERGAILQASAALRAAAYGNTSEARQRAAEALKLAPRSQGTESEAALAFAMVGDNARAESLAEDLNKRFPLSTQIQSLWLPAVRGQVALSKKDPSAAVDYLQAAAPPIEFGFVRFANSISCLYPTYVRGQAYLAADQGTAAAAEFQRIVDHSGIVWNCWTGALARLGLARAYAIEAQTDHAARDKPRMAYQNFFTLWKDADPDIPIYKRAKAEYAKLQ